MDKNTALEEMKNEILERDICAELRLGATQLVMGAGSLDADILFIGEAPGKREDEEGLPFVGASGRFLDEMIESINLRRDDVYITNIVKYRPPDNRDPLAAEIAESMPYLLRQIDIIRPKLIVTLGRFSMNVFLPGQKIGHIHGQPQRIRLKLTTGGDGGRAEDYSEDVVQGGSNVTGGIRLDSDARQERGAEGVVESLRRPSTEALNAAAGDGVRIVILPLYHPAAALYNGSQRQVLLDDFATIPGILESITNEQS